MVLSFIGLGLWDARDITVKGLQAVSLAHIVYLENYTAIQQNSIEELEYFFNKKITLASRAMVEGDPNQIIQDAKSKNVAFLVVGDVFSATTHTDLYLRARKEGVVTEIINNASILTAVGITGLQLYKFGKTTSMVFFDDDWKPQTAYDAVKQNKTQGLHTLILLDIKVAEPSKEDLLQNRQSPLPARFMTVNQGLQQLLDIESQRNEKIISPQTMAIGVARLGSETPTIIFGAIQDLLSKDFGAPMHSIIIPGNLHFLEEEVLALYH
ncbi:MAG TPA: diphthine synthase [Acidobacteriota bacterium]|nr:diphthine synthase [Acidobacteriota bacterium]